MKIRYYLLIIFLAAILTAGIMLMLMRPVDTEEQAISIAQGYVKLIFGNKFDDFIIIAELEGDIWFVYYVETTDGLTQPGGGGPELHIIKANGIPVYFALQA